jgi:nucleotide-binding universal stress UspA family protein
MANALAELLDANVEAVHMRDNGAETAVATAADAGVPLRLLDPAPIPAIIEALDADDVILSVVGSRGVPGGPRPAGHIALAIVERARKPVVVVPPEAKIGVGRRIRRVLVPLDGHESSDRASAAVLRLLGRAGVEVTTVHVFEEASTPLFLDHAEHDIAVWSDQFLARFRTEPGTRLKLRTGEPGARVIEEAAGQQVDMIALGWSQDFSSGHARTVREILSRAPVPILLVPVGVEEPSPISAAIRGRV